MVRALAVLVALGALLAGQFAFGGTEQAARGRCWSEN